MSDNLEILAFGRVDSEGKLSIYSRGILNNSIKKHLRDTHVELILKPRFYEFSNLMRSYYYAVVVKGIQAGYLASGVVKSLQEVDYELRDRYLFYEEIDEETGFFEKKLHTLRSGATRVSGSMMHRYVELCIIWAAQNLDWVIPYPSEVLDKKDLTEVQVNAVSDKCFNSSTF